MKSCAFCLLIIITASFSAYLGKTPKSIESDLYKSFGKIDYWLQKQQDPKFSVTSYDSLEKVNNEFGNKLKIYTSTYPFTLQQSFNFKSVDIKVVSSTDGFFRIYSWDTQLGGTMHDFRNVMQYRVGNKTTSVLVIDTGKKNDDGYVYFYDHLYTLKTANKTYYLGIYSGIWSSEDTEEGIRIFSIENGKINSDVKLLKTSSGLHAKISYYFNWFDTNDKIDSDIRYYSSSETISFPVVSGNDDGIVIRRRIIYKFNGQYFERIKN